MNFSIHFRTLSSGLITASSPEHPGLHMAERTWEEMWRKLPIILEALDKENEDLRKESAK